MLIGINRRVSFFNIISREGASPKFIVKKDPLFGLNCPKKRQIYFEKVAVSAFIPCSAKIGSTKGFGEFFFFSFFTIFLNPVRANQMD